MGAAPSTLYEVGDFSKTYKAKTKEYNPCYAARGRGRCYLLFLLLAQRHLDIRLIDCPQEGGGRSGQFALGNSFYLAKRESDSIIFSFVATWTNLFPKYSLTHAEGEMEPIFPKSVSLNIPPRLLCLRWDRKKKDVQMNTPESKLLKPV